MDYHYLAELLFPNAKETADDLEKRYPARKRREGAKVTRFAPSPTGFVHFGGLFPSMTGERLAHQSGGVFYLRIEDTDAKREIPGAAEALIRTLARYGINSMRGLQSGMTGKSRITGHTVLTSRVNAVPSTMYTQKSLSRRERHIPYSLPTLSLRN